MGTNQNPLQRAEVCILAMMLALLNSTLNALVCMAIHSVYPPFLQDGHSMSHFRNNMRRM